eukprot:2743233-Amphidinium_carterae.1
MNIVGGRAVIHGPVDHLPHLTAGECGGASECSICLKDQSHTLNTRPKGHHKSRPHGPPRTIY